MVESHCVSVQWVYVDKLMSGMSFALIPPDVHEDPIFVNKGEWS